MSKMIAIALTPSDKISSVKKENKDGYYTIREVELRALGDIFMIAANSQKSLSKMNTCFDLVEEVKAIPAEMTEFRIAASEFKEFVPPAIEKTVDGRPGAWYEARAMFRDIEKAREIDV